MGSDNQEIIYCAGDDEYKIYCNSYDKLCMCREIS